MGREERGKPAGQAGEVQRSGAPSISLYSCAFTVTHARWQRCWVR
eukprot:SAG11_NODE_24517_length_372_cov_0.761905_1_plen_44_part_10